MKTDAREQDRLFPIVEPVMEKVGTIVVRHLRGHAVDTIYLVGGTCSFPGIAPVIERVTGIATMIPAAPLFVTPLGIAMNDNSNEL